MVRQLNLFRVNSEWFPWEPVRTPIMSALLFWELMSLGLVTAIQGKILEVKPLYGPHTGGTLLAIIMNSTRDDLDSYTVRIGGQSCRKQFLVVDQSVILCETMSSGRNEYNEVPFPIKVLTSSGYTEYNDKPFIYKPNPSIDDVYPAVAFLGGGIQQTVIGRNLDSVAFPAMHVFYKDAFSIKDLYDIQKYPACGVINSTQMLCTVPQTTEAISERQSQDDYLIPFLNDLRNDWFMVFYMDGIVSGISEEYNLKISENPIIHSWTPGTLQYSEGMAITITGQKLNYGAQEEDFDVTIGTSVCPITHLAPNSIRCQPPEQLVTLHLEKEAKLNVKVKIGRELEFEVGYLQFGSRTLEDKTLWIIIGCCVVGVLVLTASILLSCKIRQLKAKGKIGEKAPNAS